MGSQPNVGSMLVSPGQPKPMQPGEFQVTGNPNQVSFGLQHIAPPSPLYIQRDDAIGLAMSSSQSAEVITITGRFLRANDSVVQPFMFTFAPTAQYSVQTKTFPLGEGYLLGLTVSASTATVRGMTFCAVYLTRGKVSATPLAGVDQLLCQDYVTSNQPSGWPGGRILNAFEGNGNMSLVNIGGTAAGADFVFTPNPGAIARLRGVIATLVTSATVANRAVTFQCGTFPRNAVPATTFVTASQTKTFTLMPGVQPYTDCNGNFVLPCPDPSQTVGNASTLIASLTTGIQAGDQWGPINAYYEEWLNMK